MTSEAKDSEYIWWKHGVFYHIYPRSFYDTNNDGIGDLAGIIKKLPYLKNLGIDAIWISPIYASPLYDFGYDVSDYRSIDKVFGDINEFKTLLNKAHDLDIKIIMDMILNHTSSQHPWFIESQSSTNNPKRDWYLWKKGKGRKVPNNWKSAFGGSAWEYDKKSGEYYLHSFLKEQPDLNWRNRNMRHQFFDEIKYWLDMGVDGFRLDVINLIVKDRKFTNNPSLLKFVFRKTELFNRNRPKSYKIVKKLRKIIDKYPEKILIGEIYNTPFGNPKLVASYLGNGSDSLNMAFDFSLFFKSWNAKKYYSSIKSLYDEIPKNGWPCFVLSNHDSSRSISRFGKNSYEKASLAALLLLTLKGTPFIYYGEEIGMKNTKLKRSEIHDPLGIKYWPFYKGRDRSRSPMQWDNTNNSGFSTSKPWLPVANNHKIINVETQEKDPTSILNIYKKLIKIRKKYPALTKGDWYPFISGDNNILGYHRVYKDDTLTIILNFTAQSSIVKLPQKRYRFIYSNHSENILEMNSTTISLKAYQGIILQVCI